MGETEGFKDFSELLGLSRREASEGKSHLELTVQQRHLRSLSILHGGVAASLLDSAMGLAAGSCAPPDHYTVTVQLNVNFIRPAWENEILTANGEVRHRGRLTAVTRGEIVTDKGQLVASGTATFLFQPHSQKTRQGIEKSTE